MSPSKTMHFKWLPNCCAISLLQRRNSLGEAIGPLCPEHQNKMPSGEMQSLEVAGSDGDYMGRDCCWGCRESVGPGFWVGSWEALEHGGLEPGLWGQMDLLQTPAQDECSHGDMPLRQRVLCGILGNAGAGPGRGGRYSSQVDQVNPRPENPRPTLPSLSWNHPLPCRVGVLRSQVAVMFCEGMIPRPLGDANLLSVKG